MLTNLKKVRNDYYTQIAHIKSHCVRSKSLILNALELIFDVLVGLVGVVLVRKLYSILHRYECVLKHVCEVRRHFIDSAFELAYLLLILVIYLILLSFKVLDVLIELTHIFFLALYLILEFANLTKQLCLHFLVLVRHFLHAIMSLFRLLDQILRHILFIILDLFYNSK